MLAHDIVIAEEKRCRVVPQPPGGCRPRLRACPSQTVSRVLNRPQGGVSPYPRAGDPARCRRCTMCLTARRSCLPAKRRHSIGLITASLTFCAHPSQIAAAIKSHANPASQLEVAIAMPAQADFVALQARLDELRAQHIRGVIVGLPLESATAERLVQDNPDMTPHCFSMSPRRPMSAACASTTATAAGPACATCGSWGIANLVCWQDRKVRFPPVCVSPAGARRCTV